ncbi:hypothetical protein AM501_14770 [Aneurinibacillus migulanus]|jgi:hypothetical protein|uniref:Uncharacterized protein n=1 Tax=Aneurinibacillus migulanus TaxID=47500 RepID=A0A0D1Y518_ANEMI|nr:MULTISPECIES: hypothetical protein [Aneurinibacillus]KIV59468.1 hypothetical protein TS64_01960 [Aneurinibacillus migulanus]KIV59547.1 hypothetical protein TS65_02375 [Aneurinibacillus migulanus]KON93076.1 hypothetical protein AF333_25710 [Aneurinibacillus migulanus]KPD07505.1 hypothetical protein AM501_14770 [Aneurinibacillus migulanus]MCP1357441.1 hypothetical protein [Aneurinibacillus migulanus]
MRKRNVVLSLVIATSVISVGVFAASSILQNVEAQEQNIPDIMPTNEPPYQVNIDENITPSQYEEEMRKSLVYEKVQKPKIPVSDIRLDKIQTVFSVIEQPFEKPLEKPRKGRPDKMTIDPFNGDAKYTNGIVINREGRAIKIPEDVSPSRGQIAPVVRVMTADLATMMQQPYTTQLAYDAMKKITELQKYMDALDLTEVTGILVEVNTYITDNKTSFTKASKVIQEVNKLVNFDKMEEDS